MTSITDSYAAELIAKLRADTQRTDEIGSPLPVDPRDLLILKLWDDLQTMKKGTAFLGVGAGIKPVTRVNG